MHYRYAIFDMDGTLVDSMGYWNDTCAEYISEFTEPNEELFDILKPMTLAQTVEYMNEAFDLKITEEVLKSKVYEIMMNHYNHDIVVKPGVTAFLEALQKRGVHLCVASTSPIHMVETCLRRLNLIGYFEFLISAEVVGKGKTDPDIYLEAARQLGGAPKDTMVFEDALTAGNTAKKAGFSVCAVYDVNGKEEWDTFQKLADDVITDWNDAAAKVSD